MSYITQRREEEKERRRAEIVDAAESLYSDLGWEAATIDEVARRARLSRALVYVYFKDKSDLHFAIVDRALRALRERFVAAAEQHETGLEKVQAIGRAYVAFSREVPHYFSACSHFQAHQSATDREAANEQAALQASQRVHEVLVAAIELGIKDGTIRNDVGDPVMTAISLWGFTHGIIQITASKTAELKGLGIDVPALVHHSFAFLTSALTKRA
jgi:TetR/AcrR family transcriptional regulator